MQAIANRCKTRTEKVIRMATYSVFNTIQMEWPVDTGLSRGNWFFGYNMMTVGTVDATDPSGVSAQAEARKSLTAEVGGVVYYTNNIPYARKLEYEGWSAQMPNGTVRRNAADFHTHLVAAMKGLGITPGFSQSYEVR